MASSTLPDRGNVDVGGSWRDGRGRRPPDPVRPHRCGVPLRPHRPGDPCARHRNGHGRGPGGRTDARLRTQEAAKCFDQGRRLHRRTSLAMTPPLRWPDAAELLAVPRCVRRDRFVVQFEHVARNLEPRRGRRYNSTVIMSPASPTTPATGRRQRIRASSVTEPLTRYQGGDRHHIPHPARAAPATSLPRWSGRPDP